MDTGERVIILDLLQQKMRNDGVGDVMIDAVSNYFLDSVNEADPEIQKRNREDAYFEQQRIERAKEDQETMKAFASENGLQTVRNDPAGEEHILLNISVPVPVRIYVIDEHDIGPGDIAYVCDVSVYVEAFGDQLCTEITAEDFKDSTKVIQKIRNEVQEMADKIGRVD